MCSNRFQHHGQQLMAFFTPHIQFLLLYCLLSHSALLFHSLLIELLNMEKLSTGLVKLNRP